MKKNDDLGKDNKKNHKFDITISYRNMGNVPNCVHPICLGNYFFGINKVLLLIQKWHNTNINTINK